ncbi:MAG: DUF1444 family protein [Verrucomicrobiae bacterium]|nr:DUF1444 family protein [Verrucomicrobiae bacterium]
MFGKWFRSLTGGDSEESLSPESFRDLYCAYLAKQLPSAAVEVTGELELKVKIAEGGTHGIYLDNAYQQYLADPKQRDEVLDLYIGSFIEVLNQKETPIDPERIVPVIKDRGWLEEIEAAITQRDGNKEDLPDYVSERYNSELAIFYAEDSERNIRYLTEETFSELEIERDRLRDLAVQNLKRLIGGKVEVQGGGGVFMITAGGDYEASLLLIDSLWNSEAVPVDGDFVVAIPARDLLLVTGTGHAEAIERLREMASEGAEKFSYSLTPVLFVRRDAAFEVFEG